LVEEIIVVGLNLLELKSLKNDITTTRIFREPKRILAILKNLYKTSKSNLKFEDIRSKFLNLKMIYAYEAVVGKRNLDKTIGIPECDITIGLDDAINEVEETNSEKRARKSWHENFGLPTNPEYKSLPISKPLSQPLALPEIQTLQKPQIIQIQTPKSIPIQTPKSIPIQTPKASPIETPKPLSYQTPKPLSNETPKTIPIHIPKSISIEKPKAIPIQIPKSISIQTPKAISIQTSKSIAIPKFKALSLKR